MWNWSSFAAEGNNNVYIYTFSYLTTLITVYAFIECDL